ncbi:hypothetical protein AVT69_gp056 [Pseudomonas phage PhiPA3]|uniref:Uncharacterized protein 055 n=1 Tax=Pseudomonas phage PhiPA3 TaxID=998086 RepID=F8SJT7_BPPA3|nr:hypothetical protein AVT69_gp056 [Pseudomonas phage PhiPA3]AEH03482.1 hypothetical protein [Pseudomonas phage PhiPA3]
MNSAYGVDLMDIAAGGHLDQQTTNWLGSRIETMRNTLSSAAMGFFDQARNMYQMISANDAVQALRNLNAKVDNVWNANNVHYCNSLEQIQTANPIMQRWIMAMPTVRSMYLNNSLEGYADSYVNHHGDAIGAAHYDYRRVMDGIVEVADDHFKVTHYYEETPAEERPFTLHEQVDIIRTWNLVQQELDKNEMDPTSPVGNMMG